MSDKRFPIIRINKLANKRADEIVKVLQARGIDTSKSSLVSELILSMPIPTVPTPAVEVKRRTRKAVRPQAAPVTAL